MFIQHRHLSVLPAAFAFLLLGLGTSCSVNKEYEVEVQDLDTELNLFEEGLSIPIGSSNKIILKDLINEEGESIDEYLKTDASGVLVLTYEDSTSLQDEIDKLDLDDLAKADAINISRDYTYHVGDVNKDNFTVDERHYDMTVTYSGVESVDITLDPVHSDIDGLDFKAGMDEYSDVITGNDDLKLADKIGNVGHHEVIEKTDELKAWTAGISGSAAIAIPKELLPDVDVETTNIAVTVDDITLHEDVTGIKNIQINPNAKMVISLKAVHPFISDGQFVPDIDLDLSKLFILQGGSKINLKDMVLSPANQWKASKSFPISGLATTQYGSTISIHENIVLDGIIYINDPKTTATTVSSTDNMEVEISIQFTDLTIESADISVKTLDYNLEDVMTIGDHDPFTVPEDVKDVKEVIMDQTQPLYLNVTPTNLDILSSKYIPYTIVMDFPDDVEIVGAVGGKLTFNGDLAQGPVSHPIVVKSYHPTVVNGEVEVNAQVNVTAEVHAQNLEMFSGNLPKTPDEDVTFNVTMTGTPVISDILLTINDIVEDAERQGELEFEIDGPESFGTFIITPEGHPALEVTCNMPDIPGISFVPAEEGILLMMPDIFEFDTSGLDPRYVFNEAENSLLIKEVIPTEMSLPIKHIRIHTVSVGGVSKVLTNYHMYGKVMIPSSDVKHSDVLAIADSQFGLEVTVPKMTAKSLTLDEELCIDINKEYELDIDLDTDETLKKIDVANLKDAYINIEATFEGLPDLGGEQFNVDLMVDLPEFITPSQIPVQGYIANNKLTVPPIAVEKLSNIELTDNNHIEGVMSVNGKLTAQGSNISLESLQDDINCHFAVNISGPDGKITLSKAVGIFSYDVDKTTSIKLDDLPDMLRDDNLTPDLDDPQILLDIHTNLGIVMIGDIEIVPIIGGTAQEADKIVLTGIHMPYSPTAATTVTKSFVICKSASTAPAGYEVLEANVSKLLTRIPDELQVNITASVDESVVSVVETDAHYTLDIDYKISAPLSFGPDFHFSTDTEIDMSDIADWTSYGDFGVVGKAVNDSPISLNMEMILLDDQDQEIPQKKVSVIAIQAATTSDVEFYLTPIDKDRKISKAKLLITVTALPGMALAENSYFQLTDLVAVLPEGITYTIPTE